MDRTRVAIEQMAASEPDLAARLFVQLLPAAAQRLEGPLAWNLIVDGLGTWNIAVGADGRGATVVKGNGSSGDADFELTADTAGIAALAAGESPLRLVASGRLGLSGKRLRALRLRALADGPDPTIADAVAAGATLDVDAIFRSLAYLIDPKWTRGHEFTVAYEVEGAGAWFVRVAGGAPVAVSTDPPDGGVNGTSRLGLDTYTALLAGAITPPDAMRQHLIAIEGQIYPITLVGRWIDRSQGRDDAELEREAGQRAVQERRRGSWGGHRGTGIAMPTVDGGDPGHDSAGDARRGGDLMGYGELYALWERQNWRAHELDFSVDREQWLASPREAQQHTTWSLGSFYIGEERVTADLAPFLMAAPSGEVEIFLATQLVDEARHAAFFDRFGAEVMALESDDLRGRLAELQTLMKSPWFDVFDDGLRDVADRIKASPHDLGLFVEGITTYHLIIEGVLAMTGQRFILKYMEDHGMFPGFQKGFGLVEQDEHRHIAFGVRFLRDAVASDPRLGEIVQRRVEELVPRAAGVFVPPYAESAREFTSYGYHSSHIYGFAYRKLKRRMAVLGLELPPAEDLMPGPIASAEEARAAGAPV